MKWYVNEENRYSRLSVDSDGGINIRATIWDIGEELDTDIEILLPLSTDEEKCKKKCEMLIEYIKKFEKDWEEQNR